MFSLQGVFVFRRYKMCKIKGGYVLQPRAIDGSDVMSLGPCTREIWLWLIRNANHSERNGIERGSIFFTLDTIADALSWRVGYRKETYSKPQITKALRRLCEGGYVETTKETRGIIAKVLKYSYFQDPENYEGNTKETREQHEDRLGVRTIHKNDKNDKNERKEECKNERMKEKQEEEKENISFASTDKSDRTPKVSFSKETGCFDVPEVFFRRWSVAYPSVDIEAEIKKAEIWYMSNPKRMKKNHARFLSYWFSNAQEHVGTKGVFNQDAGSRSGRAPTIGEKNSAFLKMVQEKIKSNDFDIEGGWE